MKKAEHPAPEPPELPWLLRTFPKLRLGHRRRYIPLHRRVLALVFLVFLVYHNLKDSIFSRPSIPRHVESSPCDSSFWAPRLRQYCESPRQPLLVRDEKEHETRDPLQVFQVSAPAVLPGAEVVYETKIMDHVFGWSYGQPFVGRYRPPPASVAWTKVVFNLTMTSRGRQFDRLAHLFLGDVEVWRTSTAEPTAYGIVFSFEKEMTKYEGLLREREGQKVIFELGNLLDDTYTGAFHATLKAKFYNPEILDPEVAGPADGVLPVSAMRSGEDKHSLWSLPSDVATSSILKDLPKSTIRALLSISASGNGDEEFWYTNIASSYSDYFPHATLPGYGPWREIQVLLDTQLIGVVWPYPVVFTGGIVPSLWRPIVGIGTFDLPEYDLDLTAYLPLLLATPRPAITFRVVTYDETTASISASIGQDWLLSARLHYWTDQDQTWTTTGKINTLDFPPPTFVFSPTPQNSSLTLSLIAHRSLLTSTTLQTSLGPRDVSCIQTLSYNTHTHLTNHGYTQYVSAKTSTIFPSIIIEFPLQLNSTFTPHPSSFELSAAITQGWTEDSARNMLLMGDATWRSGVGGWGRTEVADLEVRGRRDRADVVGYSRRVLAEGDKVVADTEGVE